MSQCPHHDVVCKTKLPTELGSRLVGEPPECLVAFRRELAIALLRRHLSAKGRSGRQRSDYVYMYLAMDGVIGDERAWGPSDGERCYDGGHWVGRHVPVCSIGVSFVPPSL